MKTKVFKGESIDKLKKLLDTYADNYFISEYEFGGLMYDDWEGGFMLPYLSREVVSTSWFGLVKHYKHEVDINKWVNQYLSGEPCNFSGRRDIEVIRNLYKAIKFVNMIGGEIELSTKEFAVVRDIIIWGEEGELL